MKMILGGRVASFGGATDFGFGTKPNNSIDVPTSVGIRYVSLFFE
jgi:hypothetical protein